VPKPSRKSPASSRAVTSPGVSKKTNKSVPKAYSKLDTLVAADRKLIDRCMLGDVAAWSQLYRQSHDSLLTTIRSFLGRAGQDRNLVEEIAARIWYALVKNDFELLGKFDVRRGCRLSTFLSVLAKSETRMLFRSERRRKSREQLVSRPELESALASDSTALLSDEEFLITLSPAEKAYYRDVLVAPSEQRQLAQRAYSSENMWQLNFRVRKKLERFILDASP
jgi:hypothetical protein